MPANPTPAPDPPFTDAEIEDELQICHDAKRLVGGDVYPVAKLARALREVRTLRQQITALIADRDAWQDATGLAELTPREAGEQIDADDEERYRLAKRVAELEAESLLDVHAICDERDRLRQHVKELEEVIRHCAIGQAPEAIRRVFDEVNYEAAEAAGGDS